MLVKMGASSPSRDEHNKYIQIFELPPPRVTWKKLDFFSPPRAPAKRSTERDTPCLKTHLPSTCMTLGFKMFGVVCFFLSGLSVFFYMSGVFFCWEGSIYIYIYLAKLQHFTNLDFPEIAGDFPSKTLPFGRFFGRFVRSRFHLTRYVYIYIPWICIFDAWFRK